MAQVIFFPSRPGYRDPAVTRRIMDYMLFMNSKVLFKVVSPSVHTTPCTHAGHLLIQSIYLEPWPWCAERIIQSP